MGGRWGTREIVVVHEERAYRLTFYPLQTLDGVTPSDAAARTAFDTFLRTFSFIPVTATATPVGPTVTPVPTPTPGAGDAGSGTAVRVCCNASGLGDPLRRPLSRVVSFSPSR
jgi:hypothetical protein